MKRIIIGALLLIIGVVAGWLCREHHFRGEVEMLQTDTLVIRDTHIVERIVEKERRYYDTMYVAIRDTVTINDTTYLPLPRESRTYGDERFTAVVSGYQPSLDRLEIYLENQVVTQYLKPVGERGKRNTLSLGLGVNASSALLLPVSLEYGYKLKPWFELTAEAEYELTRRQLALQIGANVQMSW